MSKTEPEKGVSVSRPTRVAMLLVAVAAILGALAMSGNLPVFDFSGGMKNSPVREAPELSAGESTPVVAAVETPPDDSQPSAPGEDDDGEDLALSFKPSSRKISATGKLTINFSKPLAPRKGERYWAAVSKPDEPDGAYSPWRLLDSGMKQAEMDFIRQPGDYEIRLFARYPAEKSRVIHRAPIEVFKNGPSSDLDVAFTLVSPRADAGYKMKMIFDRKLYPRKGEQYRLTISRAGSSEDDYVTHRYLPRGVKSWVHIVPDVPGMYEVRLHARWPRQRYNVIYRKNLLITRSFPEDDPYHPELTATFELEKPVVSTVEKPAAIFNAPLDGNYGLTISRPGASSEEVISSIAPPKGAERAELANPGVPGMYEVRLIGDFGTNRQRTMFRAPLLVVPPPPDDWSYLQDEGLALDLAVKFSVENPAVHVGEKPVVKFNRPLTPRYGEKYWLAFAPPEYPDMIYKERQFLDAGATEATPNVPRRPGRYEVRLYGRYPTEPYHVLYRSFIDVSSSGSGDAAPLPDMDLDVAFDLDSDSVEAGGKTRLAFNSVLMPRKGERYWVTIVKAGAPDDARESVYYMSEGVTAITLRAPDKPGKYEIRLNGRYPTEQYHLIHKAELTVR